MSKVYVFAYCLICLGSGESGFCPLSSIGFSLSLSSENNIFIFPRMISTSFLSAGKSACDSFFVGKLVEASAEQVNSK